MVDYRRFISLGITSGKLPSKPFLFIELEDGKLILVDSTSQTDILLSTDKGANWDTFGTGDFSSGKISLAQNIVSAFHDHDNDLIYFIFTKGGGNSCRVSYLNTSTFSMTNIAVDIFGILDVPYDVWVRDGNLEASIRDDDTNDLKVLRWTDPNWVGIVSKAVNHASMTVGLVTVISTVAYFVSAAQTDADIMKMWKFDGTNMNGGGFTGVHYNIPDNCKTIAFDGNNTLSFTLQKSSDSSYHLWLADATTFTFTDHGVFGVSFMADRNNIKTAPNELEKAFGIADEKVYEIKPRRGGIIQLQDINTITDANITAITDSFLMLTNGKMFEWTNISHKIYDFIYNGGIFPTRKVGTFKTHPDDSIYFSEGDSLKIYDDNNVLEVWAKIIKKYKGDDGISRYDIDFFSNELLRTTHNESFSANDTADKQKAIIDALDICYRDSSIVATTTNYSYVYARIAMYMFDLARFMERQVGYAEPDAKVWTKAYGGLTKAAQHFPGTYDFKDDMVGGNPAGFTIHDEGGGTINIIAEYQNHKKVLELNDSDGGADLRMTQTFTAGAQEEGYVELWTAATDVSEGIFFRFLDGADADQLLFRTDGANWQAFYNVVWNTVATALDNTLYHILVYWYDDGGITKFSMWIDGTQVVTDETASGNNDIAKLEFLTSNTMINIIYYSSIGYSWDPNYAIGDNVVAWTLNDGNQDVILIDIPGLGLDRGGYFSGSLGVTRNTVRYKNNATSTKPTIPASGKTATELLTGIVEGKEFSDAKIEASTEADQLATNRFDIFSSTIQYIGIRIKGEGFLLEGKTLYLESTDQLTIAAKNFLILSYRRDPINDETFMILTDNIIFPEEFTSFGDTSRIKLQSAIIQALENQSAIAVLPSVINQILMAGIDGFVKASGYGAAYTVLFSDVNAGVLSTFYVGNGGSFKVSIIHRSTANNFGNTAGGVIDISYDIAGGLETWNIGTQDFNLPLEDTRYLKIEQFGTAFTVANNSKVGISWAKDDNAGGAAGTFTVYGMFLTRQ